MNQKRNPLLGLIMLAILCEVCPGQALPQDLTNLEDLMNMEVTSVSRKHDPQIDTRGVGL
jgi:hypothetical protein